jgi:hypothetical protein
MAALLAPPRRHLSLVTEDGGGSIPAARTSPAAPAVPASYVQSIAPVAPRSVPMPAASLPRRSPADLVGAARAGVLESAASPTPADRYARAHLAALRAASAVLAARARPTSVAAGERAPRRGRARSVWALLATVAPELAEWGAFYAAGAAKRAAAESGLAHAVTAREADDLLRDTQTFLGLVETTLATDAGALFASGSAPVRSADQTPHVLPDRSTG